jgi:hypothetical protein
VSTQTSPVDDLSAAAKLLRERATAATKGPWRYHPDIIEGSILSDSDEIEPGWDTLVMSGLGCGIDQIELNAQYVVSMHPQIGLLLAELFARDSLLPDALTDALTVRLARLYLGRAET